MGEMDAQHIVELTAEDLFIDTYCHLIDDKGRVVVPAEFRQRLGTEFYLTISPYDTVCLFAIEDWRKYTAKLMELYQSNPRQFAPLVQRVMSFARKVRADNSGRFLLPQHLRDICKLQKSVYFIGVGDRMELMNEESYEERLKMLTSEEVKQMQMQL